VGELQARIQGMQRDRWESPGRPVSPGLAALLPNGTLRRGAVYTIANSTSLVMAILGSASADGGWSAVVGLPDFGAEAATGFGIDLARLVLVPSPGEQWLAVTAALVDVLPLVVVNPGRQVGDAEASRLAARLRQTGCTLIVAGAWSASEASLRVSGTRWDGLGAGHGYLSGRDLTVAVAGRNARTGRELGGGRGRPARLRLPAPNPAGPNDSDKVGVATAGVPPWPQPAAG
jgi:hypothetical protein